MSAISEVVAHPSADTLLLAEHFGPTVQGEGPSLGRQALFIRLSRCNLACPGCDTPYTWDWSRFDQAKESRRVDLDTLQSWVSLHPDAIVVVTGGEPLIQLRGLERFVALLRSGNREVEIETNGTRIPTTSLIADVRAFNVSPKLSAFAGDNGPARKRVNPEALRVLQQSGKARFKFVVHEAAELDEVAELVQQNELTDVWIMPEGRTVEQIVSTTRSIADQVVAAGWNLTTRLHVIAWGDERGR